MGVPWSEIDHEIFENVALEFIKHRYPEHDWTPLPLTRDGNRDGEATASIKFLGQVMNVRAWMEAKYTRTQDGLISKSHMDPTLVSALIDPSVNAVIFVTNGRIHPDYVVRARQALLFARHARAPEFFVGDQVGEWLEDHPSVYERYFGSQPARRHPVTRQGVRVEHAVLIRAIDCREGHFEPVTELIVDDEYVLQAVISSSRPGHARFSVSAPTLTLPGHAGGAGALCLTGGLDVIEIPLVPRRASERAPLKLTVVQDETSTACEIAHTVRAPPIYIRSMTQQQALQRLFAAARRHKFSPVPGCVRITGHGASGKSWTLERFVGGLPHELGIHRTQFVENDGDNARRLCGALLFATCGPVADLAWSHAVAGIAARTSDIDQQLLLDLIEGARSTPQALEVVQSVVRGDVIGSLIGQQLRGAAKLLVLDDVHKLSSDCRALLARALCDLARSDNRTLVVVGARPGLDEKLDEALDELAVEELRLDGPSTDDTVEAVRALVGDARAEAAADIVCRANGHGFLGLARTLSALDGAAAGIANLPEDEFAQAVGKIAKSVSVEELVSRRRSAAETLVATAICVVDGGVERSFLESDGLKDAVDALIEQGFARADSSSDQRIVPRHDFIRDGYIERRANPSGRVGRFLERYINVHVERRADVLGILCGIGRSFVDRYLDVALEELDRLVRETQFGVAHPLAKRLAEVVSSSDDVRARLSDVGYIRLLFQYAESTTHVGSIEQSRSLFDDVIQATAELGPSYAGVGYRALAEAELFNCRFWGLDLTSLAADIDLFLQKIGRYPETLTGEAELQTARHIAINRRMMALAALGDESGAWHAFQLGLRLAQEEGHDIAVANLTMDWAKCQLWRDPSAALAAYDAALILYQKIGTQNRRLCICTNQRAFADVVSNGAHPDALEPGTARLLQARYLQEHATALLELAGAWLVEGDVTRAKRFLSEVQARPASLENPRRRMLWMQLSSVVATMEGEIERASILNAEASDLASVLGPDYRRAMAHNRKTGRARVVAWATSSNDAALWIDPRLW